MIRTFDDLMIDGVFQKLVNKVGINPFTISYYLWGLTMAITAAIVVVYHDYMQVIFVLACFGNQWLCVKLKNLDLSPNPLRYDTASLFCRIIILLFGTIGLLLFLIPPTCIPMAVVNIPWVMAVYVCCCSNPPPKKIKQKIDKTIDNGVFQT